MILEFPGDNRDLVYLEGSARDLFLESEDDLIHFKLLFEHLAAVAVSPDTPRPLLRDTLNGGWSQ